MFCFQLFAAALFLLDHSKGEVQEDTVVGRRQTSKPSAYYFLRRGNHGSAVIGDHVYIDGGEISKRVNGSYTTSLKTSNQTLSIELGSSWTNSSVQIQTIDKGNAPVLKKPGLWPDGNGSFYMFTGELSSRSLGMVGVPPDVALWKFTATSSGGGTWEEQIPSDPGTFNQLTRPGQALIASSSHAGYALGGFSSNRTDPHMATVSPVSGLLSYDWDSGKWSNRSASAYTANGTVVLSGQMHHVPSFGRDGLIFMFGGESGNWLSYTTESDNGNTPLPFDNITMYDPEADAWYWQTTTGDTPPTRKSFCVAGAAGTSTYEIFVMSGYAYRESYDDLYILSLPGFHWFKAPVTSGSARTYHTCNTVGNRQMLVIGGLNYDGTIDSWYDPDPWTQGIGVFDMTELRWASGYDADAAAYESPQMVQKWYAQGNAKDVTWKDSHVQALFASAADESTSSAGTSQDNSPTKSSNNTGVIVGGAVSGSVGLLFLVGLTWLLFRRRKAGNAEKTMQQEQQEPRVEADALQTISELPFSVPEMAANDAITDIPPSEVSELPVLSN